MWDTFLCNLTYDDIWRGHVSPATYAKHECVVSQWWNTWDTYLYHLTYEGVTYHLQHMRHMNVLFHKEHICIKSQWVSWYVCIMWVSSHTEAICEIDLCVFWHMMTYEGVTYHLQHMWNMNVFFHKDEICQIHICIKSQWVSRYTSQSPIWISLVSFQRNMAKET